MPSRSSEAPIVEGTIDEVDDAVVFIVTPLGSCTGTLVSPHVILTARHCVTDVTTDALLPASTVIVGVGPRFTLFPDDWTAQYRAARLVTTPGSGWEGRDIGLIVLAEPLGFVVPIPIRRDAPTDRVGGTFTAIGFGIAPGDPTYGTRRIVTSTIAALTATDIVTAPTICQGDSGGPMLEEDPTRRLVGVASASVYGPSGEGCPGVEDHYARIDPWIELIDHTIIEAGDCTEPGATAGAEVCDGLDGDCDGTVDEGCVPPGGACRVDEDCAFSQLPDGFTPVTGPVVCGAGGVCTRACDPVAGAADQCSVIVLAFGHGTSTWDGARCVPSAGGCSGWCDASPAGALPDGASCMADAECASSRCADPGDGRRRCGTPCIGDQARCPLGEACAAAVGACGSCVEASIVRSPHGLGEPCASGSECLSGECATDVAEPFCTRRCETDAECGDALHCSSRCERGARQAVGGTCVTTEDCERGALCARAGTDGWCTAACDADAACPSGFACGAAGAARVCVPVLGILGTACESDGDCATGLCRGGTCTTDCTIGARCGAGLLCVRDPSRTTSSCRRTRPSVSGGCAVGRTARARAVLPILLLAVLACQRLAAPWRNRTVTRAR